MEDYTLGKVVKFDSRQGGYLDYDCENAHMLTEEAVDNMLSDFNNVVSKYFPWMKDFIVLKLQDNTIRLDVADRQFLATGGTE